MPLVSIIIPTFNRAEYLGEAVASALSQTYRDIEVIVVDDGSTDDTPEVARQLPPEVRYFRQENGGVSAARNKGIELSRGEYLCFLDSDDVLLGGAIQKNVEFLDRHPEVGFCYGRAYKMDEKGRQLKNKLRGASKTCIREGKEQIMRLLYRGDVAILTVLIRRSCIEEAGPFNTSLGIGEDIDMWLRVAMKQAVGYLAEPLGKVRVHPQNITNQAKFDALEKSQIAFVERAIQYMKSDPSFNRIKKKAYFGLYCYLSGEAARKGSRLTGFRYIMKAFKVYPGLTFHSEGFSFLLSVIREFLPNRFRRFGKQALATLGLR